MPDDLTVTGFDGVPEAERAGLTTVRQPVLEKGKAAGELLLERGDRSRPRRVTLPTELRVGHTSTAPATPSAGSPGSDSRACGEQGLQHVGDVLRRAHPVLRRRLALAHLHPDVPRPQPGERRLVRDVVADEQHRVGAQALAQRVDRRALADLHHRHLQHGLARGRLDARQLRRAGGTASSTRSATAGSAPRTCTTMLGGLVLQPHARLAVDDPAHRGGQLVLQRTAARR